MNLEPRKNALRYFFQKIVDPLGYKFSPDSELVEFCLEQEVLLEAKHGIPYCPCKRISDDRASNMKIVCPCIPFNRGHFDAMKRCWCGLFVHKDVTDPDKLKQIPASRISKG
ncbi:MAG: ferredoxin:thioredoxin reductase [Candidatus Omnitrophica bacterium]|nr:ferredoxin:thioredoxin reductase [Candidatus Omnitrophota bacterium]